MWDCHCHLADFSETELSGLLDQARGQGIHGWLSCASGPQSWPRQRQIASLPGVLIAQGLHPWWTDQSPPDLVRCLESLVAEGVAVGECGLDFYRAREEQDRELQRRVLREQLQLARRYRLPVVLHCVRSHQALLDELKQFPELRFMIHGFLGSLQEATNWLKRDAYLSLGPHALSRHDLMKRLPLDRVLIETDAPSRGAQLCDLVKVMQEWRAYQPLEDQHFEANLCRFLGISQVDLRHKLRRPL